MGTPCGSNTPQTTTTSSLNFINMATQVQVQVQHEPIESKIGIPAKSLHPTAEILARLSSDQTCMYLHTFSYYLNVVGPRSKMLGDLFQRQALEIGVIVDKVGRHMRSLGYKVPILTEIVRYNRLQNPPEGTWPDENGMLEVLMTNHENIIRHICNERKQVSDLGVKTIEDLLLEVERCHLQWAWQLRIHMQTLGQGK